MPIVVLALWIVVALIGLVALVAWLRKRSPGSRFPLALVSAHIVTQLAGLGAWIAYVVTDATAVAWTAFAVLTVGNVLGDMMLTGRFRAKSGGGSRGARDYGAAIVEILGFRRPIASLHALVGGVLYFSTLVACILAGAG